MSPAELREAEGMNTIVDQSPWMVNGKPLMVQKWSPDVCAEKDEPSRIPVWEDLLFCSHCKVFGHNGARCHKNGVKKDQLDNNKGVKVNYDNEGFVKVRNRRYGVQGIRGKNGKEHAKDNLVANENVKF
nr:zinc knuckle CX2CX4HX4C [Tanacetum cinerariifolium]